MAAGMQNNFDIRAVFTSMTTAAMNQIAPNIANTLGSSNAAQVGDEVSITPNSFTTQLALNETQGLVNGVLNKEVDKQNFNLEIISAQALGSTIGQDIGQGAINSWKAQTSYQSAQNASNGGTSAQNPGSNPNSMFGKSANTGSNNAAPTNSSASNGYGSGNTVPTSAVNNPTTSDDGTSITGQLNNALVWNPSSNNDSAIPGATSTNTNALNSSLPSIPQLNDVSINLSQQVSGSYQGLEPIVNWQ